MAQETTRRYLANFRSELTGDGPTTAIERVLIERAGTCFLGYHVAEARARRIASIGSVWRQSDFPVDDHYFSRTN